ncbi:MAG: type II toxin-antitoxin system RelE/ParE family toxin [Bacteroidetes bacterium]|nr:type II toxin-antitoxin system RelE/ParE family toxin [Bacteroidota bacterium]
MKFRIIATEPFEKQFKNLYWKYPSLKKELEWLVNGLETIPKQGTSLGADCFKIRIAIKSKGQGKSGGGRIITCVKIVHKTVYLVALYDKSEQESLSDERLHHLLKAARLI